MAKRQAKCQQCGEPAEFAYQPELETAYLLGWHQRGFSVVKLCGKCNDRRKES